MAGDRDLEFVLRFKNEAKATLQQVRKDLDRLGQAANTVGARLKGFNAVNNQTQLAFDKQALSVKRVETAQVKLAVQQQKLLQAMARTDSANSQAAASSSNAATASLRQEAASIRLAAAKMREQAAIIKATTSAQADANSYAARSADVQAYGAQLDRLRAKYNPLYDVIQRYRASLVEIKKAAAVGAISEDEMTAAINRQRTASLQAIKAIKAHNASLGGTGKSTKLAAYQMQNLAYQLHDVVVGFVSGQKPMTIFFQQGSQIAQVAEQAGVGFRGLAGAVGSLLLKFLPLAAAFAAVGIAFGSIEHELNTDVSQSKLLKGINLSAQQLKSHAKEIKITFGDTFKAVFQATANAILSIFGSSLTKVGKFFERTFQFIVGVVKGFINVVAGLIVVLVKSIYDIVTSIPKIFKSVFELAKNTVIQVVQDMLNAVSSHLNEIIKVVNAGSEFISHKKLLPEIQDTDLSRFKSKTGNAFSDLGKQLETDAKKAFGKDYAGGAYAAIREQAIKNARTRLKKLETPDSGNTQKTFLDNLKEQIALLKEETKWTGESSKAKDRALALDKKRQDAIKAGLSPDQIKTALEQYTSAYDGLEQAKDRVKQSFGAGLHSALVEFVDNAKGAGDLAKEAFGSMADGISSIFRDFATGQVKTFDDMKARIANILTDLSGKIAEYLAIQNIIKPLAGSLGGSDFASFIFSAHGNAFSGGKQVHTFGSGGVVNQPVSFPLKNGTGIAGETGNPEGILPLKRLSNGDLGVQASGAGGGQTLLNYNPTFQLVFRGGGGRGGNPEAMKALVKTMDNETRKTVYEIISREQRPGGILNGGNGGQ